MTGISDKNKEEQNDTGNFGESAVNRIWNLLASTRFAVVLLALIASAALVGAILPQSPDKQTLQRLVAEFGAGKISALQSLGLFDLFHTRWFTGALALLCVSILICSLDRFPSAWKLIKKRDAVPAGGDPERLRIHHGFDYSGETQPASASVRNRFHQKRWSVSEETRGDNVFFFINRGAYSRLGVYCVHAGVVLIVTGALVGNLLGFKGRLSAEEGETTDVFFREGRGNALMPLGFQVRCNGFSMTRDAETGMEGNYESDLTIIESGKEIQNVKLRVNHPFYYKGIGLFQASYEQLGIKSADISVFSADGVKLGKTVISDQSVELPGGGGMRLVGADSLSETGVVELDSGDGGKYIIHVAKGQKAAPVSNAYKIGFIVRNVENGAAVSSVALEEGASSEIEPGLVVKLAAYYPSYPIHGKEGPAARIIITSGGESSGHYLFGLFPDFDKMYSEGKYYFSLGKVEQIEKDVRYVGPTYVLDGFNDSYRTILDVNYDPGVWVVWVGCALLTIGLYVALFGSHRKIWIKVAPGRVSIGGTANRNPAFFESRFMKLASGLEKEITGKSGGGES